MPSTFRPGAHRRATLLLFACVASGMLHGCWWDGGSSGDVAAGPAPTPASFTVGGGVTGLSVAGLVLANGTDTVAVAASATSFTLPGAVAQGGSYAITVQTQPNGEQCSVSNATGSINSANVTNVAVACAAVAHSLGGTISGLPSSGLVLSNGTDIASPTAGALSFTFATPIAEGGAYAVAVQTQPSGATCSVGSGSGTMGTADTASVQVTCSANAYHLSGTISGLTAAGLILANGTDTVSPAANAGSFAFTNTVAFGGTFSVTVQQQPAGQTCSVAGAFPATMGPGDVTSLSVDCTAVTGLSVVVGQTSCPIPNLVDGNGTSASVPQAEGLAFDHNGNLFVIGMKSYGRAPTFLLLTGYEQARSVVSAIAGDWEAARRVELVLPETGVCSVDNSEEAASSACCGSAPAEPVPVTLGALAGPRPFARAVEPPTPRAGCCS